MSLNENKEESELKIKGQKEIVVSSPILQKKAMILYP
jgi:hypothetical protein